MNETPKEQELVPLSASRIKTFENCSWIYWSNYHLKAPQSTNDGALKGGIVHEVFELLLDPQNKPEYDKIIQSNSIKASDIIYKQVKAEITRLKIPEESYEQINDMILVGLKTDFFVEGGKLVAPEYSFDLTNKKPLYRLKGFIDKPFIKGKNIFIDDFKSSKKKYEGDEITANLQGLLYSVAATKIWKKLKPIVRFIFLQFPKDPIIQVEFSKDILKGFEEYLAMVQKKINGFSLADARDNFAADKSYGTDTFSGKLLCGFATKPGQLKKDGTKMFHCPYKFPYDYFAIVKNGSVIKTALTKNELVPKEDESIEIKHFEGCPRWNQPLNDMMPEIKPVVKNSSIWDDF